MSVTDATRLIPCNATDIVALQLLAWNGPPATARNGDVDSPNPPAELRLHSLGSGLVTDRAWDELEVRRCESDESAGEDPTLGLDADRDISDMARVLSRPIGQL